MAGNGVRGMEGRSRPSQTRCCRMTFPSDPPLKISHIVFTFSSTGSHPTGNRKKFVRRLRAHGRGTIFRYLRAVFFRQNLPLLDLRKSGPGLRSFQGSPHLRLGFGRRAGSNELRENMLLHLLPVLRSIPWTRKRVRHVGSSPQKIETSCRISGPELLNPTAFGRVRGLKGVAYIEDLVRERFLPVLLDGVDEMRSSGQHFRLSTVLVPTMLDSISSQADIPTTRSNVCMTVDSPSRHENTLPNPIQKSTP